MGLLESALTLLTGGGLGALGVWIRARSRTAVAKERTAQEAEETKQAREAGAAEVVGELLVQLRNYHEEVRELRDGLENEREQRRTALEQASEACKEEIRRTEVACDERQRKAVDDVRRDLLRISARVRTALPDSEITARHELYDIEQRQRHASRPPPLPSVRHEPRARRRGDDER